jgi:hypothetical protein
MEQVQGKITLSRCTRNDDTCPLWVRRLGLIALAALIGVLAIYVTSLLVLGTFPHDIIRRSRHGEELLSTLDKSQAWWESQEIRHYEATVEAFNYFHAVYCPSAILEVSDDVIVNARAKSTSVDPVCSNDELTVAGVFGIARTYILLDDPIRVDNITVAYDEDFGFISTLGVDAHTTLFDGLEAHDGLVPAHFGIRLTEFKVLE